MAADPVLDPVGLLAGASARAALARGDAAPLAGGPLAFMAVEEIGAAADGTSPVRRLGLAEARALFPGRMAALTAARRPFAGLPPDRPGLVGVVNVTPDSFSDGGMFDDPGRARARVRELAEAGADVIDVGGESTRPGAAEVPEAEELRRVLPAIEAARALGVPVSVDTRRAGVMREAVAAGASVVNDVSALAGDPDALAAVAGSRAAVVLTHMQGTPATMQDAPRYRSAPVEIFRWLEARVAACAAAGVGRRRIAVDPGFGFGKTDAHNIEILDRSAALHGLGCVVMFGLSRKSFLGRVAGVVRPRDRLPGTILATAAALARGVQLHRVHDAAEIRQAFAVWRALAGE